MTEITTERLFLRPWRADDLDALSVMHADPEVMRYIGLGQPQNRAETAEALRRYREHWAVHGFGLWAVEVRATGRMIGRIGLSYQEGWEHVELGWLLDRTVWGRGLATEGARAALRFGFERLGMDRIISLYHPDNTASLRVMEKLGMTYGGNRATNGTKGGVVFWSTITRTMWELPGGTSGAAPPLEET
ncbi:MAG: GNAT family N-acetyltransferase [Actinomycetota bacterium]